MAKVEGLPALSPRRRDGHKGDYGRVLVVGGAHGMAGAPCLCGRSVLRSGAGLCTVALMASSGLSAEPTDGKASRNAK